MTTLVSPSVTARIPQTPLAQSVKDALLVALVVMGLAGPLVGLQSVDTQSGLVIMTRFTDVSIAVMMVFFGRLGLALKERGLPLPCLATGSLFIAAWTFVPWPTSLLSALSLIGGVVLIVSGLRGHFDARLVHHNQRLSESLATRRTLFMRLGGTLLLVIAIILPLTPLSNVYVLNVGINILIYLMLAWGLNIVVGLAGLLDLGYVAFYAVGAYTYALMATHWGWSFWAALPLSGLFAASFGLILGFPVLRLRGDYLAIVTMGFGEIIRIVLLNWVDFSGGPNGIDRIPRLGFFGHPFTPHGHGGVTSFSEFLGIGFSRQQHLIFLFYVILALALVVNVFTIRIRRLPIGRAWEALREDEIACRALGINPTNTKLTAFSIGAMFAGFAGTFFASNQGFISPDSFTFMESATILAIVVLGGMGSQLGVALAATLVIGLTEWFRDLEAYRMVAFGLGMVIIMVWRPTGLLSHRDPTIRLETAGESK